MGATARRRRRRRRRRRTIINNILIIIIIIQHGGHTQADHYSGHERILSNWTFADICDIWRWTHWTSIIHVMVNWHLSKQGIRWPVSRDHIAGSSWVLIEVSCFFKFTADQVLVSNWIAGSSPAKTRLDAASTSSSKHLCSSLLSTLLVFRWNTVLKKPLFPAFSAVLIEKLVGHYSLRVCERKDRVVWQGFNHAGAVIGRCCVLNWTVLPLKILNWSSFLGRDGK